jgi:hypothetical protein
VVNIGSAGGAFDSKGRLMKKAFIIIMIILCGVGGFLYYDWHVKTKKMAAEPSITLYSWTDENGQRHFTDTQPPRGAKNIEEFKGYEHVKTPLIIRIKDKAVDFFKWIKGTLFKKKKNKKKKTKKA